MNEEELSFLKIFLEKIKRTGESTKILPKKAKAQQAEGSTKAQLAESFIKVESVEIIDKAKQAKTSKAQILQAKKIMLEHQVEKAIQIKTFVGKISQLSTFEKGKSFASIIAKDWHNKTLKEIDPKFFDKINGYFRSLQASD